MSDQQAAILRSLISYSRGIPVILSSVPSRFVTVFRKIFLSALTLFLLACGATAQNSTGGPSPAGLAGGSPIGSYAISDFENVNLFNGSINFRLPLLGIGGRGEAKHSILLKIEKKWVTKEMPSGIPDISIWYPQEYQPSLDGVMPGYSPGILKKHHSGYYLQSCATRPGLDNYYKLLTKLVFTTSDGTEHELLDKATGGTPGIHDNPCVTGPGTNRKKIFVSDDGSGLTFISDADIIDLVTPGQINAHQQTPNFPSGWLMMPDGIHYRILNGRVSLIRDRNGNLMTFVYENQDPNLPSGRVVKIKDSLGREVNISYATVNTSYDEISYKGFDSTPLTIRVNYSSLSAALRTTQSGDLSATQNLSYLFPELIDNGSYADMNYNPEIISSIDLPGNLKYQFSYNIYGEMARVVMPSGGAIEYDYGAGLGGAAPASGAFEGGSTGNGFAKHIYRRVVERRSYPNGTAIEGKTTYGKADWYGNCSSPCNSNELGSVKVDQKDANGTLISYQQHYFSGSARPTLDMSPDYIPTDWGLGKETRTNFFDNSGVLLRQLDYQWVGGTGLGQGPHVASAIALIAETNQVMKQSYLYDQYNNVTDVYDYEFGTNGAPLHAVRHTHTKYLADNSGYDSIQPNTINPDGNATIHLRRMPTDTWVYAVNPSNATETVASHLHYDYDQFGVETYSDITGMDTLFFGSIEAPKRGNVTSITQYLNPVAHTGGSASTGGITDQMHYDVAGNLVKTIEPFTDTTYVETTTSYVDSFKDGVARNTYAFPTQTTSPIPDPDAIHASTSALTAKKVYDFSTGLVTAYTDANAKTTVYWYADEQNNADPMARLRRVTRPDGGRTIYTYGDTPGNLYVRAQSDLDTNRPLALDSYRYFDGFGRATRSFNFDNDNAGAWIVSDIHYDALGRAWKISNPYRTSAPGSTVPACGECTTKKYDALERVIEVKTPDGAIIRTDYSGARVLITDQAGKQRLFQKNALNQLTDVWEIKSSDSATEAVTFPNHPEVAAGYRASYVYDAPGNLRKVTQGQQQRCFMFDSLSRLIRVKNPEQLTNSSLNLIDPFTGCSQWSSAFSYYPNGSLEQRTDARGVGTGYLYDALNRIIKKTYTGVSTPEVSYKYDGAGVQGGIANSIGHLTFVSAGNISSTSYDEYDVMGRIKRSTQTTDSTSYTFQNYEYDLAGNLTSQTYPSGRIVKTGYNVAGRIDSVKKEDGTPYADSFSYTPHGAVAAMKLGNGLWEQTRFNSRLQLEEIGLGTLQNDPVAKYNRLKLTYNYGAANNGNPRTQIITVPARGAIAGFTATQTYEFDALNRLQSITEAGGLSQTYDYDRYGNRAVSAGYVADQALTPRSLTDYDPNTNRLSAKEYDLTGNIKRDAVNAGHSYDYDAENRMVKYDGGESISGGATYYYDGQGQRIMKKAGIVTIVYVYNILGQLVAEYSNSNQPATGGTSYVTSDLFGSPRVITGADGEVKARHDYLPFGEEIARTATDYIQDNLRQKFASKERDIESGLDFSFARYYSNALGIFTSPDPLQSSARLNNPQTFNRYTYALNNPLRYIDPLGLSTEESNFSLGSYQGQSKTDNKKDEPKELPTPPPGYVWVKDGDGNIALAKEDGDPIINASKEIGIHLPRISDPPAFSRIKGPGWVKRLLGGLIGAGAIIGGSGGVVGPGTFTAADVALGAAGPLQAFKGKALSGSDWGTKAFPPLADEQLIDGIYRLIDTKVAAGGTIRFNLDGLSVDAAFDPSSGYYNSYPSRELRYIYENHLDKTVFYQGGKVIPTAAVFPPSI